MMHRLSAPVRRQKAMNCCKKGADSEACGARGSVSGVSACPVRRVGWCAEQHACRARQASAAALKTRGAPGRTGCLQRGSAQRCRGGKPSSATCARLHGRARGGAEARASDPCTCRGAEWPTAVQAALRNCRCSRGPHKPGQPHVPARTDVVAPLEPAEEQGERRKGAQHEAHGSGVRQTVGLHGRGGKWDARRMSRTSSGGKGAACSSASLPCTPRHMARP